PVPVDARERVHLDEGPEAPAQRGGHHQRGPEADQAAHRVGEVGPQHVHAGVGEVEHPHHREDEGEPAGEHEEEHAVDQAVEEGDEQDFHMKEPFHTCTLAPPPPPPPPTGGGGGGRKGGGGGGGGVCPSDA